jgi:hypothetical protein
MTFYRYPYRGSERCRRPPGAHAIDLSARTISPGLGIQPHLDHNRGEGFNDHEGPIDWAALESS